MIIKNEHLIIASAEHDNLDELKKLILDNIIGLKVTIVKNLTDIIPKILEKYNYSLVILLFKVYNEKDFDIITRIRSINPKIGIMLICDRITKEISLKSINNSIYSLIRTEGILDNLIPNIIFYYKSISHDRFAREVIKYIKVIKSEYVIPNSLKFITILSDHLVRDLPCIGLISKKRSEDIKIGLQEIIINAIEHGNLEITFEQKSKILESGMNFDEIIEKYSQKHEFRSRKVTVKFILSNKKAVYKIKDEGKGFDWKSHIINYDNEKNIRLEHGRGIIIALKYFDKVWYNKKGNEVVLEVHKE